MAERIFQRGLLPLDAEKDARFKTSAEYGLTFPTPTYPIDKTAGITDLGMDGNGPDPTLTVNNGQPVGDCGPCAVPAHANMVTAVMAGLALADNTMTSDEVVDLYFEFTGGQDTGVDLGDWLLWLFKKGLIKGFVKIALEDLDGALSVFDIIIVGVNLNPDADEQFPNWSLGPNDQPDPDDGHAILYGFAQSVTGPFKWASWGAWATSDLAWRQQCPQQAFAVVTDPDSQLPPGVYDELLADLTAAGGTVASAPTPAPDETLLEKIEDDVHDLVQKIEGEFTSDKSTEAVAEPVADLQAAPVPLSRAEYHAELDEIVAASPDATAAALSHDPYFRRPRGGG